MRVTHFVSADEAVLWIDILLVFIFSNYRFVGKTWYEVMCMGCAISRRTLMESFDVKVSFVCLFYTSFVCLFYMN